MREVPECLNRRYKAVDDLIQQLSWSVRNSGTTSPVNRHRNESAEPGIQLMCDFWNILKEDPDCDLKKQVKHRMGLTTPSSTTTYPQQFNCYNIADKEQSKWKGCTEKLRNMCCQKHEPSKSPSKPNCGHCKAVAGYCTTGSYNSKPNESPIPVTPQSVKCCVDHPLNVALCNVNVAATFESQCNSKINDLIVTQLKLVQQIEVLEMRENDGIKLLKKADCMWACMEESYKKRLRESSDKQNDLIRQMREMEVSNSKFRKNRKELETKIADTKKSIQGIDDQIARKKNDEKFLKMEVDDYKKRIDTTKAELDNAKKCIQTKKRNSEVKLGNMNCETDRLQNLLGNENKNKINKEKSGNKFVKEARQELQKICRVLLKKRLENEDRRAEKAALLEEIDLLNVTMDQCKDRCKLKQDTLDADIAKLDEQIAKYKNKCIQCNKCTDSNDVTRFCSDCPKCNEDRDCLYEDGFCTQDSTNTCVCMGVKERFLDNVFDNMYTVLDRQCKNAQGKDIAENIMSCLKHSINGKLDTETKKLLQDFILSTLRKNLNLTIVGGAVKTRCELEPETYEKLMLCLKKVTHEKVEKAEKSTEKKDPCKHWFGRVSECHCPSGPKDCMCSKQAPKPPKPPKPAPEEKAPKDKDAVKPGEALCPNKESACGSDCGAFDALMKVGAEMSKWRPDPCSGPACSFKNVRAVQCMLGRDVLNNHTTRQIVSTRPILPICGKDDLDNIIKISSSKSCLTDIIGTRENYPRERIIEEVMGRYIEVSPIQKVTSETSGNENYFRRSFESNESVNNIRHFDEGWNSPKSTIRTVEKTCDVRNTTNNKQVNKYNDRLTTDNFKKLEPKTTKINLFVDSLQTIVLEDTDEIENLIKERKSFISNRHVDRDVTHGQVVRISSDRELKLNTRSNGTSFIVILDSKFYAINRKISASTSSFTSFCSAYDTNIGEASVASSNDDGSSVGYLVRNIDICNAAEDLIKEVIVSESKANIYWGPEIEWMTIPSFISTLNRRSKNSFSNLSNEEVEITNTTLEAKKSSSKERSNNNFIKKLLNDMVLKKVKENLIKSLKAYNNQGSQYTYNEVTKLLNTANILSESIEDHSSSSISGPSIKKTESHSRCCNYFMQSMMNQACDSLHKMNSIEPSMICFRKFAQTNFKKSVNWSENTSANMTSTSTSSSTN